MNSKAIRKQLLAAVAMVLVAAVALGSSTYAWFVASGTVTATGMKVQAKSEGGLAISHGGTAWGTSADGNAGTTASKLNPASTKDFTLWSTATALDPSKKDADQTTRKAVTLTQDDNGNTTTDNGYVLARQFLIRSSNPSMLAKGLTVKSITVDSNKTGADGKPVFTMSTALRVGLAFSNLPGTTTSKTMIVAPVTVTTNTQGDKANQPTTSYKFYKDASDTTGADVTLTTIGDSGAEVVASDVTIPNGTSSAIQVVVYVWIEGEDNNLYSDNFHVEDLSVTVEFESKDFSGTAVVSP